MKYEIMNFFWEINILGFYVFLLTVQFTILDMV